MDLQKQRILIAEADGYKRVNPYPLPLPQGSEEAQEVIIAGVKAPLNYPQSVPDYPNDSNAMHAVIEGLRDNQFHYAEYARQLFFVVSGKEWGGDMGYFFFNYANATARQKAEAFLRTISLWTEKPATNPASS